MMSKTTSTFEDLEVWQLGRKLRKDIAQLSKEFPKEEQYKLVDQIIRASRSITANIAEGYGRYHYQENIQFCRQARGSLFELLDHHTVALDEQYIDKTTFDDLRSDIFHLIKRLNGYIKYLNDKKNS